MPSRAEIFASEPSRDREREEFDPYARWLEIPLEYRPPTHYDLFGLGLLEENHVRIQAAALDRLAHVRKYQLSQHGERALRLLEEMSKAYVCLTDPALKAQYDRQLLASHRERFANWPQPPDGSWAVVESTYPQDGTVPDEPPEVPTRPRSPEPLAASLEDPPLKRLERLASVFRTLSLATGSIGLIVTGALMIRGEHPLIWLTTLLLAALAVSILLSLTVLLDTSAELYLRIERRLNEIQTSLNDRRWE